MVRKRFLIRVVRRPNLLCFEEEEKVSDRGVCPREEEENGKRRRKKKASKSWKKKQFCSCHFLSKKGMAAASEKRVRRDKRKDEIEKGLYYIYPPCIRVRTYTTRRGRGIIKEKVRRTSR